MPEKSKGSDLFANILKKPAQFLLSRNTRESKTHKPWEPISYTNMPDRSSNLSQQELSTCRELLPIFKRLTDTTTKLHTEKYAHLTSDGNPILLEHIQRNILKSPARLRLILEASSKDFILEVETPEKITQTHFSRAPIAKHYGYRTTINPREETGELRHERLTKLSFQHLDTIHSILQVPDNIEGAIANNDVPLLLEVLLQHPSYRPLLQIDELRNNASVLTTY